MIVSLFISLHTVIARRGTRRGDPEPHFVCDSWIAALPSVARKDAESVCSNV